MISLNLPLRIGKCTPGGTCTPNDIMVSQKSLSQKMAHWVGAQCQVTFAKNAQTFPIYDVTPEKPKPKPIFFKIRTTRPTESVEGLNSSLAQSTGEVWCCKALHQSFTSGLSSPSRNHPTTFCRPFAYYACLRSCSAIVHFIRNHCLYIVCQGRTQQWWVGLTPL